VIEISFTGPTDEIGLQGTLPLSYECSGTINRGQAVMICGTMKVKAPGGAPLSKIISGCVGVAEYKQTDGDWIGVYGPGAIVRVIVSGTSCLQGNLLNPGAEGKWGPISQKMGSGNVHAIALETQATNNGTCRVLLV